MVVNINNMLESYFENETPAEIAEELFLFIGGDNSLYSITKYLYSKMDSTYKKQFVDSVLEEGVLRWIVLLATLVTIVVHSYIIIYASVEMLQQSVIKMAQ